MESEGSNCLLGEKMGKGREGMGQASGKGLRLIYAPPGSLVSVDFIK